MTPEQLGEALFLDSEAVTGSSLPVRVMLGQWFEPSFKGQKLYPPSESERLLAGSFLDHPSTPRRLLITCFFLRLALWFSKYMYPHRIICCAPEL